MESDAAAQDGFLACGGIGVEFHNQFHRPISVPRGEKENNGSSFTALLELPANQAIELLVHSTDKAAATPVKTSAASVTPSPLPIFSSNAELVDRAGKFNRFANSEKKSTANSDSLKQEADGSESDPNSNSYCSVLNRNGERKLNSSSKRKQREKKEKEGSRKKAAKEEGTEKGDYVHVRARRGQATDSHSLAERARREKINAKMKLLQEMVPGCSKISGTALVLDEIINHVQSLQRQIEMLSMRLAVVNTRTNFSFGTLLTNEDGSTMDNDPGMVMMPSEWHEEEQVEKNGLQNKQFWHSNDFHQLKWPPSTCTSREDDHLNLDIPQDSQLAYGSSSISAPLHSNQVKMEL